MNETIRTLRAQGKRRFLFLFSDTGGGHRASGTAVKDAMERLYGDNVAIDMVDFFIEMEQWPFDKFPDWYPTVVGMNGIPWALGFHLSNRVRWMKNMSRMMWPYAGPAICEVLRQHPADVIVSFHPIPNYGLFMALRHLGWRVPVSVVAVDMVTAHAGWFVPGAQQYLVPTQAAKSRALNWGLPRQNVIVSGMPTRASFTETMALSKAEAKHQVGLPDDKPAVLMVGGGEGMGPIASVVKAIAKQQPDAYLIVIAGRNKALQEELKATDYSIPVKVLGFVNNIHIWMRASDLLVTKAGPNTLSEGFISGLPIVIYAALPGQEVGNVTHVVTNNAGIWAPSPKQAATAVCELLQNPAKRERMAAKSQSIAKPFAAQHIAESIWSLTRDAVPPFASSHHLFPSLWRYL